MNRIKELRKEKKLTLKELGNLIDVKDSTLSQYENGKRHPSTEIMHKIATVFHVSIEYLSGLETDLETAKNGIYNIIKKYYNCHEFGNYRNNIEVSKLINMDYLNLEIKQSDYLAHMYDLSYRLETFILAKNKNSYKQLKKMVEKNEEDVNDFVASFFINNATEFITYELTQNNDFSEENSDFIIISICIWIKDQIDISKLSNDVLQPYLNNIDRTFNELTNNIISDFSLKEYIDKNMIHKQFAKAYDELSKIEKNIKDLRI